MPEVGEIRKGRDIGYVNKRATFIWYACLGCHKPRWVMMNYGRPISQRCHRCKVTDEVKQKMSEARKVYYRDNPGYGRLATERMNTPESRLKSIASRKGYRASEETRDKMRKNNTGVGNPFYGRKHTDATRKKMSEAPRPDHFCETMRRNALSRGPQSPETIRKRIKSCNRPEVRAIRSLKAKANSMGEKNPHWLGGISFEPYDPKFNDILKELIRQRDDYTCQLCGASQNGRKHSVHHIDYNKKYSVVANLVTLCVPCHTVTSYNRDYWMMHFIDLFIERGIYYAFKNEAPA